MSIKTLLFFISCVILTSLCGCAEINLFQAPAEVIKHPLGTDAMRIGMTKDEVVAKWGKPDRVNELESTDEWKTPKEQWVYVGRYSKIFPVDKSYLSKTKYLIFDGNNLVAIKDKAQTGPATTEMPNNAQR